MFRHLLTLSFMLFSFTSFAFESGVYRGESKKAVCYVDLIQLKGIIRVNQYECETNGGEVKIGSDETHTFPNGTYDFSEPDQEGTIQNYHAVISDSLLLLTIKEQNKENPWWEESLESVEEGKIHYKLKTGSEILFDVLLSRQ